MFELAASGEKPATTKYLAALKADFVLLWRSRYFFVHLAKQSIARQYARTALGPFWLTLSTSLQIIAMVYLLTGLFDARADIVAPWVSIGVIFWMFLSGSINDATVGIMHQKPYLLEARASLLGFALIPVIRNSIILAHQTIILLVVCVVFGIAPHLTWLVLPASLLTMAVAVYGLGLAVSIATARFRDLAPLTSNILMIGFFLSPVMWRPENLFRHQFIVDYNPFAHLLTIVRDPILGTMPSLDVWVASVGFALFSLGLGMTTLAIYRQRVIFWL